MNKQNWNIRELKRLGRQTLKHNYVISILVCIIVAILVGTHPFINTQYDITGLSDAREFINSPRLEGYSNSHTVATYVSNIYSDSEDNAVNTYLERETDKYANGVLSSLVKNSAQTGSIVFGILNALNQFIFEDKVFAGVIIFIGVFLLLLYYLFAVSLLGTGEKRFFLESRTYRKTPISRLFFLIKIRKLKNPLIVTAMRALFTFLWFLTIVGGFIKLYSYRMIPYILAENPEIKWKNAMDLSKKMMAGNKWRAFLLDLTFLPWYILSMPTFGALAVLYVNPYREASLVELYMSLRGQMLESSEQSSFYFNDLYLDAESDLDRYPTGLYHIMEKPHRFFELDYKKVYSLTNLILLFFTFSIFGWVWEVMITFFESGEFVNRGVLWGPWLPIYGAGGVLLIVLLKRWRDHPLITFIAAMVICGVIEYFTAWYLEVFKHYKWWDYTGYLLNLDGRICLEGLIVFGLGGLLFIYFLAPLIDSFLEKIPLNIRRILCAVLIMLFLCDILHSYDSPNTGNGIAKNANTY